MRLPTVWKPFQKEAYNWAWHKHKFCGLVKQLGRDIRYCHQRIWHGYCDQDLFSIDSWFLSIMPAMLEDFRDNLHGYPTAPELLSHQVASEDDTDTESMRAWIAVLDRMIFLMREADELTYTKSNQYEGEFQHAQQEFEEKYGKFGERLGSDEDSENHADNRSRQLHFLGEAEEYKDLSEKYMEEERRLHRYRS